MQNTASYGGKSLSEGVRLMRAQAPLALSLAAFVLYSAALALPLVRSTLLGQQRSGYLITGITSLWSSGDRLLALAIALFGLVAPLTVLVLSHGAFSALAAARPATKRERKGARGAFMLQQWAMPEVQVLGVLVAFTKLSHLVPSRPAVGLVCYGAAAVCSLAAWRLLETQVPVDTPSPSRCHRRDSTLLALGALILLIAAYLLPFMHVERLGRLSGDTIFTSVQKLWHQGMWGIALIVFTASLLVPVLKLTGMAYLLLTSSSAASRGGTSVALHGWIHFIGRWSMLDIFLVGFLCGIVHFPGVAMISAGPGALAFALACMLTILSTLVFDPRSPKPNNLTPSS